MDAAQSPGKIETRVDQLGVDLLSLAGHKVHAPKGIGVLYIREGTTIEPFVHILNKFLSRGNLDELKKKVLTSIMIICL